MKVLIYDVATGVITKQIEGTPENIQLNISPEEGFIEVEGEYNPSDYKVVNGEIVDKPEMELTVSGSVVTGIPYNTTACVGIEAPVVVNDGTLELVGNYTQSIHVEFMNQQFKSKTLQVAL
jgi:hypothetical protein